MQTVLIILGVLGFGAVLISAYVFTVAARNYVSDKHYAPLPADEEDEERLYLVRSLQDRRGDTSTPFPLTLPSGEVILEDRRCGRDRRQREAVDAAV